MRKLFLLCAAAACFGANFERCEIYTGDEFWDCNDEEMNVLAKEVQELGDEMDALTNGDHLDRLKTAIKKLEEVSEYDFDGEELE